MGFCTCCPSSRSGLPRFRALEHSFPHGQESTQTVSSGRAFLTLFSVSLLCLRVGFPANSIRKGGLFGSFLQPPGPGAGRGSVTHGGWLSARRAFPAARLLLTHHLFVRLREAAPRCLAIGGLIPRLIWLSQFSPFPFPGPSGRSNAVGPVRPPAAGCRTVRGSSVRAEASGLREDVQSAQLERAGHDPDCTAAARAPALQTVLLLRAARCTCRGPAGLRRGPSGTWSSDVTSGPRGALVWR